VSPAKRTAIGANADRLLTSRVVTHLRRTRVCQCPTTINAPMEVQMPTLTHRRSSDGCPRT
jgi:hypothetical protein